MSAAAPGSFQVELLTQAISSELDRLAALETACFEDPWTVGDLAPLFAAGAALALFGRRLDEQADTGYAIFQLLPGEIELLRIGVPPEARGAGTATLLLGRALVDLAARGYPVCHLEVRADNVPAIALYRRLGFALVGRRRGYYANGEDALRFRRGPSG